MIKMTHRKPFKLSIVLSIQPSQFKAVAFRGDLEENIARIASMGYKGVELAIRDPRLIHVDDLLNLINNHGIEVPAIGTGQAWSEERLSFTNPEQTIRKAAVERIKQHITLAETIKAIVIIGLIRGVTPQRQSKEQSLLYMHECVLECMEFAKKSNAKLAIEPINRYETDLINTFAEGYDFIKRIGSPNLGILLDTFHMNIEEVNLEETILKAGKNIFHFHVADSNRWSPGSGHINFNSVLAALVSTRYKGWISGEFLPLPDSNSAAKCNIEYLTDKIREL